jgi:3-hydroxy-9,10-secoandrosta-1,3,5(10)-triene-9,17-dione monooxygenase reductase component
MDPVQRYRAVIGHFPTGVTVVTARANGAAGGLTTNAVTSVSLEPLLLLVCFDLESRTLPLVRESGRFAVNILRAGQEDLARRFASKLPLAEKFADVAHREEHGVPLLDGALAWIVCDVHELLPGGDHEIGIGRVIEMGESEGEPLLYHRGAFGRLAEPW